MKIILFLFCILSLNIPIMGQIDVNRIDSLLDDAKSKVSKIDNLVLYKTLLDYDGYRQGDDTSINEWLTILYFDPEGQLKKSKLIYYFPGDEGVYEHYYENGIAIFSTYYAYSGMNNGYSVSRYLDSEGNLIKIDFIRRDDDRNSQQIERIQRTGGYNLSYPTINGNIYDEITDTVSLKTRIEEIFNINKLYKPEITTPVSFMRPQKGDITSLIQNDVMVYEKPSQAGLILGKLYVRPDIMIIDIKGDWYKITLAEPIDKNVVGYIHKSFLAPVERIIK